MRRLIALPAAALLVSPLLLGSSGAATTAAPVFRQYHAPASPLDVQGNATGGDNSGEPSLGIDGRTGDVMYMADKNTYRVTAFDLSKAEKATWTDVTFPTIGAQTSDPILYTDPTTNRTFANQLELQGGSIQAYTDDEGKSWTQSTMGGSVGIAFDHQTIVAGKPTAEQTTLPAPVVGKNYLYYCTNDLAAADCSLSIDGGLNFLAATPVYTNADSSCSTIFGHIKTDPRDGTLYLPPNGCSGHQELFVSRDNTLSWTGYPVPGSTDGDAGHPSVAVGRQDGAVYYAWGSADGYKGITGRVQTAVSFTHGKTWSPVTTLGKDLGLVASRFPTVVAGDRGRAAISFLGAKADGDPSQAPDATNAALKAYPGVWDLYVSYTADGGKTWKTYDATPGDPVQRGPVCTKGTTCLAGRNLLDFNDMVLDCSGRVAIAMADGALKAGDDYTLGLAKATVVRQSGGPSLYAASAVAPTKVTTAPASNPGSATTTPASGVGTVAAPTTPSRALASTGLSSVAPLSGAALLGLGFLVLRRRRVSA